MSGLAWPSGYLLEFPCRGVLHLHCSVACAQVVVPLEFPLVCLVLVPWLWVVIL